MDDTGLATESPLSVSGAYQECERGHHTEELEEMRNMEEQRSWSEDESDEQSAKGIEMKVRSGQCLLCIRSI